ncbi:MAG: hypothetical protein ACRD0X_01700 [Thermoanaerobaculia bacterium]
MPPHVFGLTAEALAYGRFVRAAGGFEFEAYGRIGLPAGLFPPGPLGGPLHDPAALKEALAQLVREAGARVAEASLVLPDAWLRVTFAEVGELPGNPAKLDELLRWKLERLVPFRVEDLRLTAVEVPALAGQEEPRRLMLCFGIEALLAQLEGIFTDQGARLGQIVPASLAAAAAAHEVTSGPELTGLVIAGEEGYALSFLEAGSPVLHRYRTLAVASGRERLVARDLKLTRTFLDERLPGRELARILLLSPESALPAWTESLALAFERPVVALRREQLPLRGALPEAALERVAPLLGAAIQEAA